MTITSTGDEQVGDERGDGAVAPSSTVQPGNTEQGEQIARLAVVMQAAQNATPGPTPCASAYNAAVAMVEALRARDPDSVPAVTMPRAQFETECGQLPPAYQQCLTMDYAMSHQDECSAAMQTPEVQAFRESMRRATIQP